MSKKLSLIVRKVSPWIKKNKVIDVVIFGSVMRGKDEPRDIDLCIIIKDQKEKESLNLVNSLGILTDKIKFEFHINILEVSAFVKGNSLVKTLLNEGYSIKHKEILATVLGYKNRSLFIYTLKHFNASKRVRFHYLLRGRYEVRGILKEIRGEFLGTGSILVPVEQEDTLKNIFEMWDVNYKIKRVLFS